MWLAGNQTLTATRASTHVVQNPATHLSGCPRTVNIYEKQGETKCDSVTLVPLVSSSCDLTENLFLFSRGSETVTFTLNFFYLAYITTGGVYRERN